VNFSKTLNSTRPLGHDAILMLFEKLTCACPIQIALKTILLCIQTASAIVGSDDGVWKVCIARRRYQPHNFDAFYVFTIKFSKSPARNFQTFQSWR
jgi:hypothetical protein